MMARKKLPTRRDSITLNVPHKYPGRGEPDIVETTYSNHPETGELAEVWINAINGLAKLVTPDIHASCVILSKDLQNGDTAEYLSGSLLRGSIQKSVIDAIIKDRASV